MCKLINSGLSEWMQSIENDPKYVQIASKFRSHNVSVLRLAVVWQRLVFDLTCVLLELSGFIDAEQGLWNVCRSVSLSRHLPAAFRYCGLAAGLGFCYSKNYFCQDREKKNQYRPWKKRAKTPEFILHFIVSISYLYYLLHHFLHYLGLY